MLVVCIVVSRLLPLFEGRGQKEGAARVHAPALAAASESLAKGD